MTFTDVVVGVDGSDEAHAALCWAAAEARRRGAALRVVVAVPPQRTADALRSYPPSLSASPGHLLVAAAVREARGAEPGLPVTGSVEIGPPAEVLVEAGRRAALVVVGNRDHDEPPRLRVGSVCQRVATRAAASVVVVRGDG